MKKNLIPLIFGFAFSAIFIGIGAVFLMNNNNLLENGIQVEGVVIQNKTSRDSDGTTYYPIAQFQLENGEMYTKEMNFGSNPPEYEKGDAIPIVYLPEDPSTASINSSFWMSTFPWIFISVGIFVELIMVFVFILTSRKAKQNSTSSNSKDNFSDRNKEASNDTTPDKKDKGHNPFLVD